ncbi:DNA sulfur modification protein DndB [Catenulispora rubra]|uniref:DNA sulfur modification protein DndB n=1 Tax=Catenulispora rubra TaxID=280293 RepID=UPI00189231B6|nr:DNA sulfur modification protein DndB [Catenulispora rubra]
MPKIQLPVIAYQQGGRQMFATAMSPADVVQMVRQPKAWGSNADEHGNRPLDKPHLNGIVTYIKEETHFVVGAAVLYITEKEVSFRSAQIEGVTADSDAATIGTLTIDLSAQFDIGDGQHRIGAYEHVLRNSDGDDPVMTRLRESGQPLIIVVEDDPRRRAQDFADLQQNVKPMVASLGLSMDRRQPITRVLNDLFDTCPIFIGRVDFLKDNPGKLSKHLFSFKTIRYTSGLALVGNAFRTQTTMDKRVNDAATTSEGRASLSEFWTALGELPGYGNVINGGTSATDLREGTYLTSAGVLYGIATAVWAFASSAPDTRGTITAAVRTLDDFNFSRTPKTERITTADTPLAGTLIDPGTGKLANGRTAWEGAAAVIGQHISRSLERANA